MPPVLKKDQVDTAVHIGFALLNLEKNELMPLPNEEDTVGDMEYTLVYSKNGPIDLTYKGSQAAFTDDNGRDIPSNFVNKTGQIFVLSKKFPEKDDYALITSKNFPLKHKMIPFTQKFEDAEEESNLISLALNEERNIKEAKLIAETVNKDKIFLVQFTNKNNIATVLLVLQPSDKEKAVRTFRYDAQFDVYSTWSVDDGGEFPMDLFKIAGIFSYNGELELFTISPGAEGGNFSYLIPKSSNDLVEYSRAYAYWSPL